MTLLVGSFSASWALLGVWGSLRLQRHMEQEKGTEVPEGDLWLQKEREREIHTHPGPNNAHKGTPVNILTF